MGLRCGYKALFSLRSIWYVQKRDRSRTKSQILLHSRKDFGFQNEFEKNSEDSIVILRKSIKRFSVFVRERGFGRKVFPAVACSGTSHCKNPTVLVHWGTLVS